MSESTEAFTGVVQPHTFTIQTGRITDGNTSFLAIHHVSVLARALSRCFARAMTAGWLTNRNADSHLISVPFRTTAHIWCGTPAVDASYANWFTNSVRIASVSFTADAFLRQLVVQPTTVIVVITCVDVFGVRKKAVIVTVIGPADQLAGCFHVRSADVLGTVLCCNEGKNHQRNVYSDQ